MSTRKSPPALNRYVLPIPERVPPHDTPMNAKEAQSPPAKEFLRPPAGAPNVLIVLIDFVLIWALEKLVGEGGVSF